MRGKTIFTMLFLFLILPFVGATGNLTTCLACLNTSINCSVNVSYYAENSTYYGLYYMICENYLNNITSLDNDNRMIGTILAQMLLIVFLVFVGYMSLKQYREMDMGKISFWLAFMCFGLVLIEIMITLGIVYVNEDGGSIAEILYINLWTVGFISFLVGMTALTRIMFGLMDITGDQEKIKEW